MRFFNTIRTDWGTAAGALLTAAAMFAGGIAYAVHLRDDASASKATDADHETRLRGIETHVTHIDDAVTTLQGDVTWIRQNMPAAHGAIDKAPQTASR
jgi:hypothetical protein